MRKGFTVNNFVGELVHRKTIYQKMTQRPINLLKKDLRQSAIKFIIIQQIACKFLYKYKTQSRNNMSVPSFTDKQKI